MSRWFVVAEFSRWERRTRDSVKVPLSILHAKEMGTLKTACGIPCETWAKWWGRPFASGSEGLCPSCVVATQ